MGVSEQPWHRLWCYLQAVGSGAVVWVCSRVERGLTGSVFPRAGVPPALVALGMLSVSSG